MPLFPDPDFRPHHSDDVLVDIVAGRFLATVEVLGRLISVTVQNGVVILEGRVDTHDSRAAAGRLAWSTPGVTDVLNLLKVDP